MSEQLEIFLTGALSQKDLDACVALIEVGGALTNPQTAADELPDCPFVVVKRDGDEIVGVGTIKGQRPDYAAGIASKEKSGYQFDPHMHELGYVVVKESHRDRKYSKALTERLLSLFQGKPLFATTSNPKMATTLAAYGFTQRGKSWKTRKGNDLSLWIKD